MLRFSYNIKFYTAFKHNNHLLKTYSQITQKKTNYLKVGKYIQYIEYHFVFKYFNILILKVI